MSEQVAPAAGAESNGPDRGSVSTTGSRALKYRADIDGLRALAIILVVAYHVGVSGLTGGFVGVDVFFVISGYLITTILWKELGSADRIDWGRFYARRVRRLIPALTLVVLVTLVIGVWLMLPNQELRWLGQSAVSVATFLSNFFFESKTDGYFGADAELLPLLNTWSLAVEEQFYLVWPLVLVGLWRAAKYRATKGAQSAADVAAVGIGALALISFVAAEMTVRVDQSAAFYLMPFRLWELAAGGFLAVVVKRIPTVTRGAAALMALVGMLLISYSVISLDAFDTFPGLSATPTVLGTVLVVVAGTSCIDNPVSSVLSLGPLVWVGTLSYSWYLIHWPLLVFARLRTGEADLLRDGLIAMGSLFLAALSYRFVEQPFREGRWPAMRATRPTLLIGFGMLLAMIVAGVAVATKPDSLSRVEISAAQRMALDESAVFDRCGFDSAVPGSPIDCVYPGATDRTLVLVGDSHAASLLPAVQEYAERSGWSLEVMWHPGCPFVLGYEAPDAGAALKPGCVAENRRRMDYLVENAERIDGVVVNNRSDTFMYTVRGEPIPEAAVEWEDALRSTIGEVAENGIPTMYVLDGPVFDHSVPVCLIRMGESCDEARPEVESFRAPATEAALSALREMQGVEVWDPLPTLCDDDRCFVEQGGDILYIDGDHLSGAGTSLLSESLGDAMSRAFGATPPGGA